VRNGSATVSGIGFGQGSRADEIVGRRLALAFTPRASSFPGSGGFDLQIADFKVEGAAAAAG
jgi:hypothetical protein